MNEERKCSEGCGRTLGAANKSGVCSACSKGYEPLAERELSPKTEAPPKPKKPKAAPESTGPDWQRQFFQLAEALGLNPEEMLTDFCRGWVEDTRAKALGRRLDITPETPAGE